MTKEQLERDVEDLLKINELLERMEECTNIVDLECIRLEINFRVNALEKNSDLFN